MNRETSSWSGMTVLILVLALQIALLLALFVGGQAWALLPAVLLALFYPGFYMLEPNQAAVLSFFGRYVGTVSAESGLRWNNPFYKKKKISYRIRNFESGRLKVNELDGSPIEIAAVVVWQVEDAAAALYQVDHYESFVYIQAEAALRHLASQYPYDQHEPGQLALRSHSAEISSRLQEELSERLEEAGVRVLDARISHLAYAPEIAQAMLQRQQANAVIAARERIVLGAVSMVDMALKQLQQSQEIQLTETQKANMVSNLLVVLCSERGTQPVLNQSQSS